jgi:predicted signal transduction protein with EAL and GGDEF domain
VVLEDVADASAAIRVAERIQEQLRAPVDVHDRYRLRASASIGIALGAPEVSQQLVHTADLAMYEAKGMGKGCVAIFDPNTSMGSASWGRYPTRHFMCIGLEAPTLPEPTTALAG